MLKKMVFILILVCSFQGFSEDLYSPMKFGFHAKATGLTNVFDREVFSYPQFSVGATLHIIPEFALRPSVIFMSLNGFEEDLYNNSENYKDSETLAVGGGVDLLLFLDVKSNICVYLGAGYKFVINNRKSYSTVNGNILGEKIFTYHQVPGIVGVQYLFNKNFGFFMETGLSFLYAQNRGTDYDSTTGDITGEDITRDINLTLQQPVFGAVFYLN